MGGVRQRRSRRVAYQQSLYLHVISTKKAEKVDKKSSKALLYFSNVTPKYPHPLWTGGGGRSTNLHKSIRETMIFRYAGSNAFSACSLWARFG